MTQQEIRVWLLVGPKAGDNTQLRALGAALAREPGWEVVEKPLRFRGFELLLHALPVPTLAALDRASRRGLAPPWPHLVLSAGRRNELVARWIARRGRSRLVHLGRPWSRPERFDLVVSTPQYRLPPGAGVMVNALPLHPPRDDALQRAAQAWQSRLEPLPRPRTAVLIGGDSGAFVFSPALARDLAARLNAFARARGGSLLVTTSPRTPEAFTRTLQESLNAPGWLHVWSADQRDNPYQGLLALADGFVVTAESVSMLAEALGTGRPVYLAPVAPPGNRPWWLQAGSYRWKPLTHRLAMALAPERFHRDVGRIHRALLEAGRVAWLGEAEPASPPPPEDALASTVARIRTLLTHP